MMARPVIEGLMAIKSGSEIIAPGKDMKAAASQAAGTYRP